MPAKPAPSVCPQNSQENVDCNKVPPCPPSHQPKEKVEVGGREKVVGGPTFVRAGLGGGGHEKGRRRRREDGGRRKSVREKFALSTALPNVVVIYADKSQVGRKISQNFPCTSPLVPL